MTKNIDKDQEDVVMQKRDQNNGFNGMAKKLSLLIRYLVRPVKQSVHYIL